MDPLAQTILPQAFLPDLVLETPARSAEPANSFLRKPNGIKNWLRELPLANIEKTGSQLHQTLAALNRVDFPNQVRAEVIELFREPVRYVSSNMAMDYVDIGFPMGSRARNSFLLSYELCMEMTISYKIIIKEQLAANNKQFNQKLVIVAIHRALQYLGQALLQSYLSYSDPKRGIWREIHFLYDWAMRNEVHTLPVKETAKQGWKQESPCIEDLYKSHVLMSTIPTQSLRHTQIRRIHDKLNDWSKLTKVMSLQDATHGGRVFLINLNSDNPPYRSTEPVGIKDTGYRTFDLSNLIARLQTDIENSSWESPSRIEAEHKLLSRSLLSSLLDTWNKASERLFARRSLNKSLKVVLGISSLHYLLEKANTPPATIANQRGENPTADLESWKPTIINDVFSLLADDESIGGYRLRWKNSIPSKVRVGDILGILANESPGKYALCIIRWLKYLQDGNFSIGIQIVSPSCHSASLVPLAKASSGQENHYRCLLLNNKGMNREQAELISETREFELNTILRLNTDSGTRQIMLIERLESNNRFIHYRFKYLQVTQSTDKT